MKREHIWIDPNLGIRKVTRTAWHVVRRVLRYAIATVSLAVFYYIVFALLVSTDKEKALIRENRLYSRTYAELLEHERLLSDGVDALSYKDEGIYEEVFHTKVPKTDPVLDDDYLYVADTIPDRYLVEYSTGKVEQVEAAASRVEQNFRRILSLAADGSSQLPPLAMPLEGISYVQVGASIGQRVNPFYKVETLHEGIDLIAPQGDPVLAAADGTVTAVTHSRKGEGNVVEITHAGGYVTRYAHVADIVVSRGQKVARGRRIASVGISGSSFAPHLHYEVRKDGVALDPVDCFFASVTPDEYANMKYMASRTGQSLD